MMHFIVLLNLHTFDTYERDACHFSLFMNEWISIYIHALLSMESVVLNLNNVRCVRECVFVVGLQHLNITKIMCIKIIKTLLHIIEEDIRIRLA